MCEPYQLILCNSSSGQLVNASFSQLSIFQFSHFFPILPGRTPLAQKYSLASLSLLQKYVVLLSYEQIDLR